MPAGAIFLGAGAGEGAMLREALEEPPRPELWPARAAALDSTARSFR